MIQELIVFHTADWHIGANRKNPDYLDQAKIMMEAILKELFLLMDEKPEATFYFFLVGDIFDRNEDTRLEEFILFLNVFFIPMRMEIKRRKNLHLYVIDGNHDRKGNPSDPSVLNPLLKLGLKRLRLATVSPQYFEDTGVLLIPFNQLTEARLRELIEQYDPIFVLAHECLARMMTDVGYSPPRDQDRYLEIENVLTSGTRLAGVFLGDIHKCQSMDKYGLSWYSGSPTTHNQGERLPKGVLVHPYRAAEKSWERIEPPYLQPLRNPELRVHHQLGVIKQIEKIPWPVLRNFQNSYLQLVVIPEVYHEIDKEIPGFFQSINVSYSFYNDQSEKAQGDQEQAAKDQEELEGLAYYKEGLDQWVDGKKELTLELKNRCKEILYKKFENW